MVVLDSTPLPVKVVDDVFGTPVTVHLTIVLGAYTHSIVAFRLTPVAESSIDVAMLSRDVLPPLPMRPGWGESMAWPYLGVPAELVTDLAGRRVAVLRPGGAHRRPRGGARGGESAEGFAGGGAGAWCVAVGAAGDLGDLRA
ncbi:hypothetical protein [Streptomyces eurythermus]|uniref:hypothetical protein n=1 Tax=Streptomyces eurythermus TaxID=42237 RepID=UPI0033CBB914